MYDAGSRKSIRAKEKVDRLAQKNSGTILISIMSSTEGRAYIWGELSAAHVFTTSFSPDPLTMAFTEGERNTGLRLLNNILFWAPEEFIQMMREQNERDRNPDGKPDDAGGSSSYLDGTDDSGYPELDP